MITYVVQTRGCDELVLVMDTKGGLNVEGMTSGKTDQLSITRDPFIGSAHITMVGIILHIPHSRRLGNDVGGGSTSILVNHWDGDGGGIWAVDFLAGLVGGIFVDGFKVGKGGGWFDEGG